jgi:hypothetical protein
MALQLKSARCMLLQLAKSGMNTTSVATVGGKARTYATEADPEDYGYCEPFYK